MAFLAEQQPGPEAKVAELLLVIADERRRAELAEKARREAVEQAMQMQSASELQLREVQQQLEDEIKKRMAAYSLVAQKERTIMEMQTAAAGGERSQQQAPKTQVLEKMREVCSLQQQLAEELSKRQKVQNQLLEKERKVCALQQQILGRHRRAAAQSTPPPKNSDSSSGSTLGDTQDSRSDSPSRAARSDSPSKPRTGSITVSGRTSPSRPRTLSGTLSACSTPAAPSPSKTPAPFMLVRPPPIAGRAAVSGMSPPVYRKAGEAPLQHYVRAAATSGSPLARTPTARSGLGQEPFPTFSWRGLCATQVQQAAATSRDSRRSPRATIA